MKKRSCAALLSLFMVLTMLPVTAFAAEPDVPEIAVATLHDTSNSLADNELYTAYKIVEKGQPDEDGIIPVHISVDGLKKHANAQNNMGYWAGLAVACPEGAGNPSNIEYRMSTWADDESISTTPLEANVIGDKPGIAFYYNLDEFPHAQKQYAYVKFADGYEYLFEITFTATLTGEKSEDHGTLKNTYGGTVNPEDANEIVFDGNDKLYFSEDKQCWVAKVPITPPAKTFDKNTFAVHFEGDGGAKPWNEMVTFDEATGDLIIQSPLYQPMDFYDEDGNGSFTLDPTLYYYDVFLIDWDGDKGCDQEIAIKIESNVGFDFSNTPVSIKATDVNNKETVLFTCTDPVFASSVYNGLVDFYSDSILYITGDVTINEEDNDSGIYIPPMGVLHTENSKITVGDTSYFAFHPEFTWIVGSNTSVDLKGEFCPPLGVEADYKKLNCDIKASGPNASIRILNGDLPILLGSAIIEDTADNYIRMSEDGEATLNLADLSLSLNKGIFTSENFPAVLPALNPNYNPEIPEESEENPEEPEENPIIEAPLTINVKADAILDVPADNMIFTVNIANIHGELKVAEGGTFEGPATVYGKAYIQGDIADATFTLSGKDAVILSDTKITLTNPDADVVELTGDKLTVDGHTYQFGKMLKATSDDSGSGSGSGGTSSPSTKPVTKPTTPTEPTKPTEPTAPATVGAFKDVPTTSYYAEAVQWAVDKGVTNGTSDTTFAPTEVCTRAQALTCLWRAVGSPEPDMTNNPFGDVAESDYYYKAVLWAIQNGITKGVSDSAFDPNAECRRAQCLTFLYRTFDALGDGSASVFSDVDDDSYYFGAVSWAFSSGVTNGTSATTFSPDDPCVRADMVSFLYRAFAK